MQTEFITVVLKPIERAVNPLILNIAVNSILQRIRTILGIFEFVTAIGAFKVAVDHIGPLVADALLPLQIGIDEAERTAFNAQRYFVRFLHAQMRLYRIDDNNAGGSKGPGRAENVFGLCIV